MREVSLRTPQRAVEVAWFSALCSDDYEYLGVPDGSLRSSYQHCGDIVRTADRLGYQNILLPSGWIAGQDALTFAAGMTAHTQQINQLVALRMGEVWPPMLARAIATVDHMAQGRLCINIISSDLPGSQESNDVRYARSSEVIQILQGMWRTTGPFQWQGQSTIFSCPPANLRRRFSKAAGRCCISVAYRPPRRLCAKHCDVFLMWPETEERLLATMRGMSTLAQQHERTVDYGLRIHVIVRESESEARQAADRLISKLDRAKGEAIKNRSQDSRSAGVLRQDELRASAGGDLYIEPHLWSGIGLARSGCGSALVGDPDQILAKLNTYIDMGIRAFILSGYPHEQECRLFAQYVLPRLTTCRLNEVQQRRVADPVTPLTTAPRS